MNQILITPKIYTQTFQWWEQKLVKACTGEKYWWWGWWWWWHGKVVVNFLTEYETMYRLVNTYVWINFFSISYFLQPADEFSGESDGNEDDDSDDDDDDGDDDDEVLSLYGALMSDSDQSENITLNLYWNLCFRCFPLRRNPKSWTKRRPETS